MGPMNDASSLPSGRIGLTDLLATAWPATVATDSMLQQRKKLAIRAGHLAMVIMVLAVVAASVATDFQQFSGPRLVALLLTSLAYIGWSIYGTRGVVRLVLWSQSGSLPPRSSRLPYWGAIPYFTVQLALAGLVYSLGEEGHTPSLVWLALLPPVAYGVFLLERVGITLVSVVTLAVFVTNVVRFHGWKAVPYALLAFSFAVLFTLVFTLLAVSAEKTREDVQRLAAELGEANRKLREYAVQVEELAATRERNRLAREIHDSLGHYLTVINVQLEAAKAVRERDPLAARQALDKAQALTQEGLQEIRSSVAALRSSPLDNKTLAEALRQLVEESRSGGLAAEMELRGQPRSLPPQAELTLYRAGQEGFTNVRKHARAKSARLVLDFQSPTETRLSLTDDGAGAQPTAPVSMEASSAESQPVGAQAVTGFGLLGLRERVHLLGGRVSVRTAPNAGFTLEVEVPT